MGRTDVVRAGPHGADPVELRPKEGSLVAALALKSPRAMSSDDLIWTMWGERGPATARKSLTNHVARVRSAAGNDLVVTVGTRYQLGPAVATDVARLQELRDHADRALVEGDWQARLAAAEAASALRRGPPYADLPDIPEVVGERNRIEELVSQLEEDVTETWLLMGRYHEAAALLERSTRHEPYRERRWEQLLVARFLAGNRRSALQVAEAAAAALAEVGLTPGARLRELESLALLDDDRHLVEVMARLHPVTVPPMAVAGGSGPHPDLTEPFVGREDDVAVLDDAVRRAAHSAPVHVVVSGEAGIGKTTLVRRYTDRLVADGTRVAWGSGSSDLQTPMAAWAEVVGQLCDADPGALDRLDPADGAVLRGLGRGRTDGDTSAAAPAPTGGRERQFEALAHLLADQGRAAGLIVVLDDLHLTSPSTRRMARRLAASDLPVVLIATVRTADPDVGRQLFDVGGTVQLRLQGLQRPQIDGYLRQVVDAPIGEDAVNWVEEQTGGNPLLLRETARILVEHRSLAADRTFLPPPSMGSAGDALLLSRLDGLAAETVNVLRTAAVLGPRFWCDELARLVPRSEWHLGEAQALGLVVSGAEPGEMAFAHQLLREAVYRTLPVEERLELHEAVAAVLAEPGSGAPGPGTDPADRPDPVYRIAEHHLAAASLDPRRAIDSLQAAATLSLDRFAYEDAALHLEEGARVARRYDLDSTVACGLDIQRGDALRRAGDPGCTDVLFDAAACAEEVGAGDLAAAAALALCRLGPTTATGAADQRAARLVDRALAVVIDAGLRAELKGEASLLHSMGGEPDRCRSLYDQAESEARRLEDPWVLSRVLPHAYLALGAPWDLERRSDLVDEVSALGRRIGDASTEWEGCLLAYSVQLERGDPAVFPTVRRARHLSDLLREPTREWETQWMEAGADHLRGDLEGAERRIEGSLASSGAVAPSRVLATYGAQLLAIRIDQGRVAELLGDLERLVDEQPGVAAWRSGLALAAADSGRSDLALDQLSTFWRSGSMVVPGDFTWTAMLMVLARAAARVGTTVMRADLAAALEPYSGRLAWGGSCSYGPIDTGRGLLLAALGDRAGALAAFERGRAVSAGLGADVYASEAAACATDLAGSARNRPPSP